MANTTWNPADKIAGGTLSNGNLTATSTVVRSVASQTTGKYYWEYCPNVVFATSWAAGIANSSANLSTVNGTSANACFATYTGNVWLNGGLLGPNLGTLPIGSAARLCVALDLTNKRIWYRSSPAGQWNASGTANPATNVGGVDISVITSTGIYALFAFASGSDECIANFGDSAFSGVAPAGYTAGFPSGGGTSGGAAQARAMVLA